MSLLGQTPRLVKRAWKDASELGQELQVFFKAVQTSIEIPTGTIALWETTTPPDGWLYCDGSQGTPDLSAGLLVGAVTLRFIQKE